VAVSLREQTKQSNQTVIKGEMDYLLQAYFIISRQFADDLMNFITHKN
jgi:hypothetical protein